MAFRTITARYDGTCRRCEGPIAAGERIRYGGRGRTYHFADVCDTKRDVGNYVLGADNELVDAGTGSVIDANHGLVDTVRPVRVHVTRFSSGDEVYRNVRGRCEDAPCCGCCTY